MKTAISLTDEIFDEAEGLAKRLRVSRSELYSRALREYLARHSTERITGTLDRLCEQLGTGQDAFVSAAARRALERSDW